MTLSAATPELPVTDEVAAQEWYVEQLGFEATWHVTDGRIAAVRRGDCALFLRGGHDAPAPQVVWVFAEDVDAFADEVAASGVEIAVPLADTPWGLRQFTVRDPSGHLIHFHHDL